MMDPADRLLERYVEGTSGILPSEGSGEWGLRPRGVTDIMHGSPDVYKQHYRTLTAAQKIVLDIDDIPDYWIVRVHTLTSAGVAAVATGVFVYPYQDIAGEPIAIDQGSKCHVPGRSNNLTIIANANGATVSVIATRGHDIAGW